MDTHENDIGSGLQRLSDAGDWEIGEGHPDIRGWDVMSTTGDRIGRVDDLLIDTRAERVRAIEVARENDAGRVRYAIEPVQVDEERHQVIVGVGSATGVIGDAVADEASVVRHEEELDVSKRTRQAGEVAIRKRVETEHVREVVPRTREEVTVERRPVTGDRSASPTIGQDEIRVPVVEEEIVVEKRPVVKEELVVKVKPVTEEQEVSADLKKEHVEVDRTNEGARDRRPDQR